ncbi:MULTISPECIES: non-hydrolyzing UDP-N-acetylglucosamine 2-epimerase [unclassified Exiguobacterium]|uniref:non-hydrolyzing UDP-N-acetylglucosamine 2-epimerase n=1 Tax=unclassified Exiguobacterium TaxID=2644629 RepID=UPI00103F1C8A|nr:MULTISPECIES: UDP-N-acetylglucosamine 2-epimerase (non-hydrolyzing) [unclassified Exiguobacterium]TCI39072.1 UDP-N-acetylglucosamine 2-epimerase (non-hydrolyzing) [Exiguobacterium sp. SH4S7]TCI48239.1 UDP-N-acetylglucosamine 2-epimerase (non-hydrolyzing) [Exiguobacterium sp. SH5S32]TCI55126.1 UDP-N-acetylglucosamine 2-epimerase (non-hydrolyzing) [Exiguobacterium sp. SH1S4]TCI74919.1 UDP-N-acetylglucosamine 2-epimerase (non-hydrolyzing) [Exiguobacterium sp. SH1S1]
MNRLKVMTIVGTRPEIIRLSAVIAKLEASEAIEHILVHTGQNYDYELNEIFFEDFGLRTPDYILDASADGPMATIGNILIAVDPVLKAERPDAVLILGDTNSCLAAIAVKRHKIPIFHMEAGNRCFDERVPEETNRRIVDHIADVNLTYSDIAREYLLKEGLPSDRVIKTGSPMFEVLTRQRDKIDRSDVLDRLGLTAGGYFVVSAHRDENISADENFFDLVDTLNAIAETYDLPLIISTHPRTANRIRETGVTLHPNIRTLKPLGFSDYVHLQLHAKAVLSDSGTISEESSILGLKGLNIRQAHERPEAMEEGAAMMVGLKRDRVLQALRVLEETDTPMRLVSDYAMPNVSDKVLRILLSYTDYVMREVWKQTPGSPLKKEV